MTISARTRKRLWTKAGNRCTLCKCRLIELQHAGADDVIVGDEAHIVSSRPTGPRHRHLPPEESNGYGNLVLLCRNDHRRVDDEAEFYTEDILREAKLRHERWIDKTIAQPMGGTQSLNDALDQSVLHRVRSGSQLVHLMCGTLANSWGWPADLGITVVSAGKFADLVNQVSDVLPGIEFEVQAKIEVVLDARIKRLEEEGLFLYGKQLKRHTAVPGGNEELLTAVLRFAKVDHEVFIDLGLVPRELLLA